MSENEEASGATRDGHANPQESLSQLVAKILDQLSLSAWLPAGVLVSIAILYGTFHAHTDVASALDAIGAMSFTSFLLSVFSVIVVTVLTQAFEFAAIRLLEGYWGAGGPGYWLGRRRCAKHLRRRDRIRAAVNHLDGDAFALARSRALKDDGKLEPIFAIIEAQRSGWTDAEALQEASAGDIDRAESFDWRVYGPTDDVRKLSILESRLREFPQIDYRVHPTRLGNVLRSFEDRVHNPGKGSLEGMVQRVFHQLPATVQSEHDQFRTRLDVYCSLVLVFALATVTSLVVYPSGRALVPVIAAVMAALAYVSYRAAITSARAYGGVLETIDDLTRSG